MNENRFHGTAHRGVVRWVQLWAAGLLVWNIGRYGLTSLAVPGLLGVILLGELILFFSRIVRPLEILAGMYTLQGHRVDLGDAVARDLAGRTNPFRAVPELRARWPPESEQPRPQPPLKNTGER